MLGREERHMLECAALLHDIGWSQEGGKHHKASMNMILNEQELPFRVRERYMIASIARYHNSLPRSKHYNIAVLKHIDRRCVSMLSAILRIADSLDSSHGCKIGGLSAEIDEELVIVHGTAAGSTTEEVEKFGRKKDLFERVFKRSIELKLKRKRAPLKRLATRASLRSRKRSSPAS